MGQEAGPDIVIGSGMAGLTAGAFLSRADRSVLVLEQADHIGGVTATIRQDGFAWDIGPMMVEGFGPGEPARRVLDELGIGNDISLVRGDRGLFFPDFAVRPPEKYDGPEWRKKRLKALFPEEAENIEHFFRFLKQAVDLINLERQAAVSRPLRKTALTAGMALLFPRIKAYTTWTAGDLMESFFRDERLKAYFLAILADMTILPEEYPAMGIPFSNQENAYDRRIPPRRALGIGPANITFNFITGGCGKLAGAMASVIENYGGKIRTSSGVKKIILRDGGVAGVELSGGEVIRTDRVFATGGARECFFSLIGREHLPGEWITMADEIPLMESVFMVHLGVAMDVTRFQAVPLNYYYGTYDIAAGVERIRSGVFNGGEDGFLIYIPSLHSPGMAPAGAHSVTVYTIAPNSIDGSWSEIKGEMAEILLDRAEKIIPGLREHEVTRFIITPEEFGRLTAMPDHHSFGGYCPMMNRAGSPHRTPVRGLWFLGSQSENGPGVWTQIISARNLIRDILKEKVKKGEAV